MQYIYELSNEQIISLLRGEAESIGIMRNGNQIVRTDRPLEGVTPLNEVPAEVKEYADEIRAGYLKQIAPKEITIKQARLALLKAGLLESVEQAINNEPDETLKKTLQIEWEYMLHLERDNALLAAVAQRLGLSDMQIDELFIEASKL